MAIERAAKQITENGLGIVVAGGQDNISAVQAKYLGWVIAEKDPGVVAIAEHAYMSMLNTGENVAKLHPDIVNANGGGIAIGHPYGMTVSRLVLFERHTIHNDRHNWGYGKVWVSVICNDRMIAAP